METTLERLFGHAQRRDSGYFGQRMLNMELTWKKKEDYGEERDGGRQSTAVTLK